MFKHIKVMLLGLAATLVVCQSALAGTEASCGYTATSKIVATWPKANAFRAHVLLSNKAGARATTFKVFLDIGDAKIRKGELANYEKTEGGYFANSPAWLAKTKHAFDRGYMFSFIANGVNTGVKPYIISINGIACDTLAPSINITSSQGFFSATGTLTLTGNATDNVAIRKVVFEDNGKVVGQATKAPFTLNVPITSTLNGAHNYTATAYDFSGNATKSKMSRVFVNINNRFIGSAPGSLADFEDLPNYFNQLTPENAGKWESVEAVRGQMNWTDLDYAYNFAKTHKMQFKMHTLIWGQQAPKWIDALPPAEQLAEIEEWMSLVAQRYPDLTMIDVVNEALHAPLAFRDALGGNGVTGYDWVIKSFELARQYFPNAQLILNDYNILIAKQFTEEYLSLIGLLQAKSLIDGIGLQAHYLEKGENSVVESNLALLAATGLPIYISELDVNIKDDALQANRMRDLFTIFWRNPAVVGVTFWGHLEGDIWQTNAYLIHKDKTLRPAMTWLVCYSAGNTNCTVPIYEAPEWIGNAAGLTLQAEEYDAASGVLALGNVVAYTDPGDWIAYNKVSFQSGWDSLAINYSKGNTELGSISIHLDSLESPAISEIELPATGGWGNSKTINLDWAPIAGQHKVFIRFNRVNGIANLDSVRFYSKANIPGLGSNLVDNSSFEDGTTAGWFSWNGTITADSSESYNGTYSLKLSNRAGNGPAAYSLAGKALAGKNYAVSMRATIKGAATDNINVTQKIGCAGSDTYSWFINPVTIEEGQWVELKGSLSIPNCVLTDVLIFVEGPAGNVEIFLDDVSVKEVLSQNLITNGDFEEGQAADWFSWNGTISASTELAQSGSYSLKLSNRNGNGPAAHGLSSIVEKGKTYNISLAVSIQGAASAPVNLTGKLGCDSVDSYTWLANTDAVLENQWTTLTGDFIVPASCNITDAIFFVEGPAGGINLFVDDVLVSAK